LIIPNGLGCLSGRIRCSRRCRSGWSGRAAGDVDHLQGLLRFADGFLGIDGVAEHDHAVPTGADLALPHVDGTYPRDYWLRRWIVDQVFTAATHDPEIGRRFHAVTEMLRHPNSLTTPGTLIRSVFVNLQAGHQR
jgi:hypothetical protein